MKSAMTNEYLKNPTFVLADDLANICEPLKMLKIDSFSHLKSSNKNSFSFLATNPAFIDIYFKKKYYNFDIHTCDLNLFGNYIVWDDIPRTGLTRELEDDAAIYGVRHTFTIVQRGKDENNFYHFSSSEKSFSFNQVYLANLDLLNLFIHNFNKTIASSNNLSNGYNQKFYMDENTTGFSVDEKEFIVTKDIRSAFKSALEMPVLSPREEECVAHSLRGKSAKEIAQILGLSFRTIETYLEKAKTKFDVASKSQLIEKWHEFYRLEDKY